MVARANTPTVLIVDAEPYVCRVFEAKLSKDSQFATVSATSGQDALAAATRQSFDVLLWDMRLRDTLTLLPRIRALCPNAALILLTTDDRPQVSTELGRLDVADILIKPPGMDTLIERVRQAMILPAMQVSTARVDLAHIGQRVTVASPGGVCETRVLDSGQDTFAIIGPPRVATPDDFRPRQRVRVEVKGMDALYRFDSRLLTEKTSPVPHWELQMPRNIRREQRRKYPRTSLRLRATLQSEETLSNDETEISADRTRAVTEDISLGGCALVCEQTLPVGTKVRLALSHPSFQMQGEGRIVQAQTLPPYEVVGVETPASYRLGVAFAALDAPTRRRLRALLASQT